jgi:hypothetical protein
VTKEVAVEKARVKGGESEVEKIDDEYDVKVSKQKAADILNKMWNKIEKAMI